MPPAASLPLILAHARAGALGQAWRLFEAAGLGSVTDDAAVLAVRGRLLKEQAASASGASRTALLAEGAAAYAAAGAHSAASYHLINAASLALLAGDVAGAVSGARQVLATLDANPDEAETPYWRGATRAEALLLLGRTEEAKAALAQAVAAAPRAWEDHAPTLRQFALIAQAQGADTAWLEAFRPPRTLHFAGHMSLSADDRDVRRRVDEMLAGEDVGFGYGALAAGADILIAEALAARGAELILVLPATPDRFRAESVARQGADWGQRYDTLMGVAASVRTAGDGDHAPNILTVRLAAQMAMGQAALRARALQTEALQLLVLDLDERDSEPGGSGWARAAWADSGRRQFVIQAPRHGRPAQPMAPARARERLMAVIAVGVEPGDIAALAEALATAPMPSAQPNWMGRGFVLAFESPAAAAAAIDAIRRRLGLSAKLAGAYGVVSAQAFPGMGASLVTGPAATLAAALADLAPHGACHLGGAFAAALVAAEPTRRVELVCALDLPGASAPTDVYALGE